MGPEGNWLRPVAAFYHLGSIAATFWPDRWKRTQMEFHAEWLRFEPLSLTTLKYLPLLLIKICFCKSRFINVKTLEQITNFIPGQGSNSSKRAVNPALSTERQLPISLQRKSDSSSYPNPTRTERPARISCVQLADEIDCRLKQKMSLIWIHVFNHQSYFKQMHPQSSVFLCITGGSTGLDEVEGSAGASIRIRKFYQSKANVTQYGSQFNHFIKAKRHSSRNWI